MLLPSEWEVSRFKKEKTGSLFSTPQDHSPAQSKDALKWKRKHSHLHGAVKNLLTSL